MRYWKGLRNRQGGSKREDDTTLCIFYEILTDEPNAKFKNGAGVVVGIDHDYYDVPPTTLHHDVVNLPASTAKKLSNNGPKTGNHSANKIRLLLF